MERRLMWILAVIVLLSLAECVPRKFVPKSPTKEEESSEDDDDSKEDKSSEDDACLLEPSTGPCKGLKNRYYFDQKLSMCRKFVYGGCDGNKNNFKSPQECMRSCAKHLKPQIESTGPIEQGAGRGAVEESDLLSVCSLPPTTGNKTCFAFMPRWTFNSVTGRCETFIYGGCGGTKNVFKSEEKCMQTCGATVRGLLPDAPTACTEPISAGPCYGTLTRYGYNKEKNRCESFVYGGCEGSGNNFLSAEQCQQTCGGEPVVKDESGNDPCASVKCKLRLYQHYTQKGCQPKYIEGACCPSYYECPDPSVFDNKCFFDGKYYEIGQDMPEVTQQNPCRQGCFCAAAVGAAHNTSVTCANVECPEQLGWLPAEKRSCTRIYSPDSCCASDFVNCGASTVKIGIDGVVEEKGLTGGTREPICSYEDKTYVEGEKFFPKTPESPCQVCVCTPEFNGIFGPGCRTVSCTIRLPNPGCVPIYDEGVCCPYRYKCPAEYAETGISALPPASLYQREGPFINVGIPGKVSVSTLPAVVGGSDPAPAGTYERNGPFIQVGAPGKVPVRTLPIMVARPATASDPTIATTDESATGGTYERKGPFIQVGAPGKVPVRTLPIAVERKPSGFVREGPLIETGMEGKVPVMTLPARIRSDDEMPRGGGSRLRQERCFMEPESGPCKSGVVRYAFVSSTGTCEKFEYGGCGGNENRFASERECLNACKQRGGKQIEGDAACTEAPIAGRCRAHHTRYFYNPEAKECQTFTYGGCGAGANNYKTEEECKQRCAPVPVTEASIQDTNEPAKRLPSVEVAPFCTFGGVTFQLGEQLDTSTDRCVECTCSTPPELTCVKRSPCPAPAKTPTSPLRVAGGVSEETLPVTEEITELAKAIKADVEAKLGRILDEYEPVGYRKQVVSGYNYFIKVRIGVEDFIHVKIYKDFQRNVSVTRVLEGQSHESELGYF